MSCKLEKVDNEQTIVHVKERVKIESLYYLSDMTEVD